MHCTLSTPQCLLAAVDFQHELGLHVVDGDLQAVEVRLPRQAGDVDCDTALRTKLADLLRRAAENGKSAPLGNKVKVYEPKESRTLKIGETGSGHAYIGQQSRAVVENAQDGGRELSEEELKAAQQPQGLMAYLPYVTPMLVVYMCASRFMDDGGAKGKGGPPAKK